MRRARRSTRPITIPTHYNLQQSVIRRTRRSTRPITIPTHYNLRKVRHGQ